MHARQLDLQPTVLATTNAACSWVEVSLWKSR